MLKLKVEGMSCDGCARSVSRAVIARLPAAKVAIDLPSGWVTIEGPADATIAKQAIVEAGYTVAASA
ncbi:MAG: copper chaperone [Alphaproteobacteria bacterium]|nr:copper chaperone [Alphaproteobacteria bacterium]